MLRRADPIPNFSFGLEIGEALVAWFTECSGLAIEREVTPYKEGGVNDFTHQLPGPVKRLKVTLKHGLADNSLWAWLQKGVYDGQVERRHVSIILFDSALVEVGRWDLLNVYPGKWAASDMNAAGNEPVLETLELVQGNGHSSSPGNGTVQRVEMTASESLPPREIDLPALARQVYDLLKQELRLERERLGCSL